MHFYLNNFVYYVLLNHFMFYLISNDTTEKLYYRKKNKFIIFLDKLCTSLF